MPYSRPVGSAAEIPDTLYARSGEVYVAYQAFGDGAVNIVAVPGRVSNVELIWDDPDRRPFYGALASFARVIIFDKRGTGASDRVVGAPILEQRLEDVRAVMDAAGVERAALYGADDGAALAALFAATYPDRAVALMLWEPKARGGWARDYPWGMRDPETAWGGSKYTIPEQIDTGIREQFPTRSGDEEFRRRYVRMLRLSASPTSYAALYRMWFDVDIRHVLGAIQAPTLVMHGGLGDVGESQYVVDRIGGARLVEFPEHEAAPFYGDIESPVRAMRDFIAQTSDDQRGRAGANRVLTTVLFTDLIGSTAKAVELGPHWQHVLREHNAVVRRELARFRGREIDTAGDGFFASGFDGPARAIRCGCAIRDAVSSLGLGIRVGVHTGECDIVDDKLSGLAVNIGARVAAQANEGDVLVSGTVKDLVAGSGIEFEARGVRELKGLGEWPLYAVSRSHEDATSA
jgi:class 3 adenylate cyclase